MKTRKATFNIGSQEYEFKDLTIRLYYELQDLLKEPNKDSELKIVSIMTECPVEELKALKKKIESLLAPHNSPDQKYIMCM